VVIGVGRVRGVGLMAVGRRGFWRGNVGANAGGDGGRAGAAAAGPVSAVASVSAAVAVAAALVDVVGGLRVGLGVEGDDHAAAVAALTRHRERLEQARAD